MAALVIRTLIMKSSLILGYSLFTAACPQPLRAQPVRENGASAQQVPAKPGSQNPPSAQTPQGKKRLSQEVQVTSEQSWIDTGIDVQSGEHLLITATGRRRYGAAKGDNAPAGTPRALTDAIRV